VLASRHLSAAGINNRLCRLYRNCSSNFFSLLKEKVRPKEKYSLCAIFRQQALTIVFAAFIGTVPLISLLKEKVRPKEKCSLCAIFRQQAKVFAHLFQKVVVSRGNAFGFLLQKTNDF